jgi:PAS domain S-box-containing protein
MEKDTKKYKILVVEDNPGDFALIEEFLQEKFLTPVVEHAMTYKEVSELFWDNHKHYDAVLLDLSLPDKSDEMLIKEMVKFFSYCPIIVLTGYPDISFGIRSLSFGISDYLLKDELNSLSLYKSITYNIERKKFVVELEASEQRYSDLFHLSPQPMWVYDVETLRFLEVNSAAIEHYGYSLGEFLEMTIKDIRPAEDIEEPDAAAALTNNTKAPDFEGGFRHKKKNGDIILVDIRSNLVINKGKKVKIIIINDITDRLKYINEIEAQNRNLQEIAWVQSHVVRAPLARFMGLVGLMKDVNASEPEKEKLLQYVLKSAEEFDEIIKDIVYKTEKVQQTIKH